MSLKPSRDGEASGECRGGAMGASQALTDIYVHNNALQSIRACGLSPQAVATTLVATWQTRVTSGSKVKALRDVPGTDYRLRLGKFRGVFSVWDNAAFLHMVEPRDRVYERDAVGAVLRLFYSNDTDIGKPIDIQKMGYERVPLGLERAYPQTNPEWLASIGYLLRPSQQFFFNKVLPLEGSLAKNNPRLVIGYGPPGSGKTVVGVELALETVMDGHRVDILVPSRSLKNEYGRLIRSGGSQVSERHGETPGLRVLRFDEYFSGRAGIGTTFDREARILGWAHSSLSKPGFQARIAQAGKSADREKAMEELPVLIDVLLEDDTWWDNFDVWRKAVKDPLIASVEPYLTLLGGMRNTLFDLLDEEGDEVLATRAALASAPRSGSTAEPYARLTIIDEAQDLAPAEWRTLLDDAFAGDGAEDRRIVLLGDMQQRVSRVPFSWSDIKRFATGSCRLPVDQIADLHVDKASYRMKRSIAQAAGAVFDKRVHVEGPYRRTSILELDRLPEGGTVRVAVVPDGEDPLAPIIADSTTRNGEYLFLVQGRGVRGAQFSRPDVINYSVKEAKGLEADRVVVQLPFGNGVAKSPTGRLGHDGAMEFYTAFSRARDHVFLIVEDASWGLLSQAFDAWHGAEIKRGAEVTKSWLESSVDAMRIGLSAEDATKARLDQIRAIASSSLAEPEGVVEKMVTAVRYLARIPHDEVVYPLLEIGVSLASTNAVLHAAIRARYRQEERGMTTAEKIAVLCLLGELALATETARSLNLSDGPKWGAEWISLVCDESPIQRLRRRRSAEFEQWDWTDDALEKMIIRKCIDDLDIRKRGSPPGLRLREFEAEIMAASENSPELAADALGLRRVVETLSKVRSRIEDAERRANDTITRHAHEKFNELSQQMEALRWEIRGSGAAR